MFYLDLEKDNNVVTIEFQQNGTTLGQKWSEALRDEIDKGIELPQSDRIYNLNNEWSEDRILLELNDCIDKINEYEHVIDYKLTPGYGITQDDCNFLHHYFETLRGENEQPVEFYDHAPRHIKKEIDHLNVLIHRKEDLGAPGRIVVHINDRPVYPLEDNDFDNWTLALQPGDIRLNYCHKGKTIWDVFKDGDTVVGDDNIRPQFKYCADFVLGFNNPIGSEFLQRFNEWWNTNQAQLSSLGFERHDPRCAIGHAVVGRIVGDPITIKQKIMGSTKILGVRYD